MLSHRLIGLCLSLLVHVNAAAESFDVVRVANGEWPPILSQHLPGHGPATKIITEAYTEMGVKVEYGFFPWRRSYELAKTGKWDVTPFWTRTPEREKDFLISDNVFSLPSVFLHRLGNDFQWQQISDLAPYKIGITRGYTYGAEMDQAIRSGKLHVVESDNDERNIRMLGKGIIDIFPIALPVGQTLMQTELNSEERALLTIHPKPYKVEHYALMFGRQNAKSPMLLKQFNEGLRKLSASGRLGELQQEINGKTKVHP
ncbi:polar amino acid transport system substrate-binding protein [Chitinivorax tropicus]|uniref:Polar amino acid transport system substrate-binding protein n=1 Tax=Chitinivorax tropicus TaxID=714531 RepID=A0A840MT48_9PROT|nr:transporter substrate-binding domain-containing protein [Chitinivorax tropicus]MBB5019952.1 polar amino acid transport system substrate-binding protein [Chitinivorax tropicus]